ncbi:MAG: TrmH family RNA methyltransferase [Luteibaculaceae bacterium]|jgi:TrmH family RNA methyltransferase
MIGQSTIKEIGKLKLQKFRKESGLFLVEGEKLVLEVIQSTQKWDIKYVLGAASSTIAPEITEHANFSGVSIKDLGRISTQKNPDKVIAVVAMQEVAKMEQNGWFIYLDGVQDPGNLGAIVRIALWYGFAGIITDSNCPDAFNPKVIRGSMGGSMQLPFYQEAHFDVLKEKGLNVFVADMHGENIDAVTFPDQGILIVGAEGPGVSPEMRNSATKTISIPKIGAGESLNVAVATGIIAHQIKKQ